MVKLYPRSQLGYILEAIVSPKYIYKKRNRASNVIDHLLFVLVNKKTICFCVAIIKDQTRIYIQHSWLYSNFKIFSYEFGEISREITSMLPCKTAGFKVRHQYITYGLYDEPICYITGDCACHFIFLSNSCDIQWKEINVSVNSSVIVLEGWNYMLLIWRGYLLLEMYSFFRALVYAFSF